jgi:hypothetical protein
MIARVIIPSTHSQMNARFHHDAGASRRTALLVIEGVDDSVTEIDDGLDLDRPVLEHACPLFSEAAHPGRSRHVEDAFLGLQITSGA